MRAKISEDGTKLEVAGILKVRIIIKVSLFGIRRKSRGNLGLGLGRKRLAWDWRVWWWVGSSRVNKSWVFHGDD